MAKLDDPAALDKHMATKSHAGLRCRRPTPALPQNRAAAQVCERGAVVRAHRELPECGRSSSPARRRRRRRCRPPPPLPAKAAALPPSPPPSRRPLAGEGGGVGVGGGGAGGGLERRRDALRAALTADGKIADTLAFAAAKGLAHDKVIGECNSLAVHGWIATKDLSRNVTKLTAEGEAIAADGSPEAAVFKCVPVDGIDQAALAEAAAAAAKVG